MGLPKKSGTCSICAAKGKTEWHHIISQAKIKRLEETDHNYNNDLLNNPNNLIELCKPCHKQTDSHLFWRWINNEENATKHTKYGKIKRGHQCNGLTKKMQRCRRTKRSIPKGGYCSYHLNQAPVGHPQNSTPDYLKSPPPGLRDEDDEDRYWTQEHIMTLQDIHYGVPIGKHALELFEKWSEGWKRRWLYQEEW
jgi:hypothetical protein